MRTLQRRGCGGARLESLLDEALAASRLTPVDRALAQELVFGAVRWQATLDWLIHRRTNGRTQKPLLQTLLRLGLYQAFWLDRIPDHAVAHETVQLARELGCGAQSGFINALLRGCLRDRETIERELQEARTRAPHLGYSHPEWLCTRWHQRWGQETLVRLLEWNNTPAPVYARVNTLRATPETLAARFEQEGVLFTPRTFAWTPENLLFKLRSHPPLSSLPSFQEGLFYVQDPSTLLAARELAPLPGETVLDLCAAPGGKTTLLAQQMQNQGTVRAEDPDPDRLARVQQNCARLGVTCVTTGTAPAMPAAAGQAEFDRVLVDAPCSNTGVMRRRVELRWRLQLGDIERLANLQLGLLQQAARRLKPAGTLVYSTCSLEPEENEEVVCRFLETAPEFRLVASHPLLPFRDGVDGAYVAKLHRRS